MCPQNKKRGGELPTLVTPLRVGPRTLANPQPTGVGKTGVQGAEPPWRGVVGGVPHKFKRGGEAPTLTTPLRVGPRTLANLQPTGVGAKGGPGGGVSLAGGVGGSLRNQKMGQVGSYCNPATSRTKTPANLSAGNEANNRSCASGQLWGLCSGPSHAAGL